MRFLARLRPLAFVYVTALIMVVGSERVYWYYTDADLVSFAELAAFYALGVYALLWLVERYRATGFWSFFVAVPVFGYVIEGVITPVLYEGGPTPFFPVYFTAWHGLVSAVLLWYLLRRWLIAGRWRAVLAAGIGLGAFWGTQATTMWLPESLNDPELAESNPAIRSPADFLLYAIATTAALIGAHWLLGRGLWLRELGRSRLAEGLAAFGIGAVLIGYTIIIPWAGPMFAVLVGTVVWVLRRHRRVAEGPAILEQLDGRVSLRALAMLVALPLTAGAVYGLWTALDPPMTVVRDVSLHGVIAVQLLVGAVLMAVSWLKVLRGRTGPGPRPTIGPGDRATNAVTLGSPSLHRH